MHQQHDGRDNALASELSRDTWTIDTRGLLAVLLKWANSRRQERGRVLAVFALKSIIGKFLDLDCMDGLIQAIIDVLAQDPPCEDGLRENCCRRLRQLLDAFPQNPEQLPQDRLVEFLLQLDQRLPYCASMRECMRLLITRVSELIFKRFDQATTTEDPIKVDRPREAAGRKRSWGESFKRFLTDDLAKRGKARHAPAIGVASGACSSRLCEWQQRKMASIQACLVRAFGEAKGTIVIASDGARLGNPAEETNVYLMSCPRLGLGTWMIPQVSRFGAHYSRSPQTAVRKGKPTHIRCRPLVRRSIVCVCVCILSSRREPRVRQIATVTTALGHERSKSSSGPWAASVGGGGIRHSFSGSPLAHGYRCSAAGISTPTPNAIRI